MPCHMRHRRGAMRYAMSRAHTHERPRGNGLRLHNQRLPKMGKLNVALLRYLSKEDFRVLTAVS